MKIRSVQLWFPGQNNPTLYKIDGTIRSAENSKLMKIHGLELSPTGEVVILREDGGANVYGYVPYELDLVPGEGTDVQKNSEGNSVSTT